ncbi:MAG: hypothetical protein Q9195_009053 [Heterodermia aff. obscurata]
MRTCPAVFLLAILAEASLAISFQTGVTSNSRRLGNRASTTLNATRCPLGPGAVSSQAVNGSGSIWPYQLFRSSTFNPPQLQVTRNAGQLAPGFLFLDPTDFTAVNATQDQAPLIMTDAGQLVWNGPYLDATNLRVASYEGKAILTFWSGLSTAGANIGHGYGNITFLDSSYTEILTVCPKLGLVTPTNTTYECEADLHESYLTDRNTLLITAYNATPADLRSIGGPEKGWVFDCLFLEINPRDGSVLFRWSALEHVPVSESKQPLRSTGTNQSEPFDYFHINSVANVGTNYLVNSRHAWSTYLVSSTGDIVWTIKGDTGGDFGPLPPHGQFSWQHHARARTITSNSIAISWFNNNNAFGVDNGTKFTTGLELLLPLPPSNTSSTTVRALRYLSDPSNPIYAASQGSFSILPNGNIFMGYGEIAVLKEYGPNSSSGAGDVRWTARFGADNLVQSYRGFKAEWHATPKTKPSLAVESAAGGCGKGYVSWNGATDVEAWAIYEGEQPGSLREVGRVGFKGFETSFGVASAFVQVGAVVGGEVVRRSEAVSWVE